MQALFGNVTMGPFASGVTWRRVFASLRAK